MQDATSLPKYDIVYFVKDCDENPELIYSLRSVCKNFPYRRVYIYGTQPKNIQVDKYYHVYQTGWTKWDKVQQMLATACLNNHMTDYIWIFNDDFYVTKPVTEYAYYSNGRIREMCKSLEKKYGHKTSYSTMLEYQYEALKSRKYPTLSYTTHTPFLIKREYMLECMRIFSEVRGYRNLYGNFIDRWSLRYYPVLTGKDIKIRNAKEIIKSDWPYLSSSDQSFNNNEALHNFLTTTFNEKCKYER